MRIRKKDTIIKVQKVMSYIYIVLFICAFTSSFFSNTMISVNSWVFSTVITVFLVAISYFSVIIELFYITKSAQDVKLIDKTSLIRIILILLATWSYSYNGADVYLVILFAITAPLTNGNMILKISFWIGVILTSVLLIFSLIGAVTNIGGKAFGFAYPDFFTCCLLCLTIYYCVLKDGWLTWVGELGLLIILCLSGFAGGRTAGVCLFIITITTYYRHYKRIGRIPFREKEKYGHIIPLLFFVVYIPIVLAFAVVEAIQLNKTKEAAFYLLKFIIPIVVSLSFILMYLPAGIVNWFNKLPVFQNIASRIMLGRVAFDEVPITLFGTNVPEGASIGNERPIGSYFYFVLDNSYQKLLLQKGLLIFLIIVALLTWIQIRFYKEKRYYAMIIMTCFTFDTVMETSLRSLTYSVLLLLAFCKLPQRPRIYECTKLNLEKISSRNRLSLGVGIVIITAIFSLWISTAYQITTWRGWTPHYGATLVIPFDDSGLQENRLRRAKEYLSLQKDAMCIAGEGDKDWLVAHAVDESRVITASYLSIDDMLIQSSALISENSLPPRLTVCTYDIEQELISRHAAALHIPVNSLTMQVPFNSYLKCFAKEQWRLLWGE